MTVAAVGYTRWRLSDFHHCGIQKAILGVIFLPCSKSLILGPCTAFGVQEGITDAGTVWAGLQEVGGFPSLAPQLDTAEKQNDEATTWGVVRTFASGRVAGRLLSNLQPKHGIDRVGAAMKPGVTTMAQFNTAINELQKAIAGALGFELNRVAVSVPDPVSRESLVGMENNLRTQRTSSSLWPVKWHGLVNERLPMTEGLADRSELRATSHNSPAVEWPGQQQSSQASQLSEAEISLDMRAEAQVPQPAELPWWMPQSHRAKFELNPASAHVPLFHQKQAATPDRIQTPLLTDWFRNNDSGHLDDSAQLPAVEKPVETQIASTESRIQRLRGLVAGVGLASLLRNRAPLALDDVPQSNETQAPLETAETESVIEPPALSNSSAEAVETPPAIVSPREFVPVRDSLGETASTPTPEAPVKTTLGFDDNDEIRTLPAKRGQYSSQRRG